MGGQPPKKRRTKRKQGLHRSHQIRQLAEQVNARSPVKVWLGKKAGGQTRQRKPASAAK